MHERLRVPTSRVFGYIMAALSQALFVSGALAAVLHPLYHGHLERPDEGDSHWVQYFTLGTLRVDHRLMLGGFVAAFLVAPVALGVYLARHSSQPRFQSVGSFIGFGLLLLLGAVFNVFVMFGYLITNWNSSEPF